MEQHHHDLPPHFRPPIAPRSHGARSQIDPQSTRRMKADGRSAGARRYRALVNAYAADLGGELSEADRGLVEQAAMLSLRVEQLTTAIVNGAAVDDATVIKLAGASRRALSAISARSIARKPGALTLQDHLARRAAELASDDENGDE